MQLRKALFALVVPGVVLTQGAMAQTGFGAQGTEGEPNRMQQWLVPSPDPNTAAHAVLASYGRKDGHRTYHLDGTAIQMGHELGLTFRNELTGVFGTVANFLEAHPAGKYLVRINGHAFAVIDGGIHDLFPVGPRSRVKQAWRVAA